MAAGGEHVALVIQGGVHILIAPGQVRVGPEQLAVGRVDADDRLLRHRDQLAPAVVGDDDRRAVGGRFVQRVVDPDRLAGQSIQRNHQRVAAARDAKDQVALDGHVFAHRPSAVPGAESLLQIGVPNLAAALRLERSQPALRIHLVEHPARPRRCRPRTGIRAGPTLAIDPFPKQAAVEVQGDHFLDVVEIARRENPAFGEKRPSSRDRSPTASKTSHPGPPSGHFFIRPEPGDIVLAGPVEEDGHQGWPSFTSARTTKAGEERDRRNTRPKATSGTAQAATLMRGDSRRIESGMFSLP